MAIHYISGMLQLPPNAKVGLTVMKAFVSITQMLKTVATINISDITNVSYIENILSIDYCIGDLTLVAVFSGELPLQYKLIKRAMDARSKTPPVTAKSTIIDPIPPHDIEPTTSIIEPENIMESNTNIEKKSCCQKCGKKGLFVKISSSGLCDDCTQLELFDLREALNPDQKELVTLKDRIRSLKQNENLLTSEIKNLQSCEHKLSQDILSLKSQIVQMDEQILLQDFGLYEPKYEFTNSNQYKEKLAEIRQQQKQLISCDTAVAGNMDWQVNGSISQGQKMIKDMKKLLLRAFNSECDEITAKVKYSNFESSLKRMAESSAAISKLGTMMSIGIQPRYYKLKVEELTLAFEFQQMKQAEKEEQKEIKAQMREEARLQKELEDEKRKIEKEQIHYTNALSKILSQIEAQGESKDLLSKKSEIELQLSEINKSIEQIDYRQANQRAGYVYVISNIGAFGEDVFKIGMTRRLEPIERIDELGDASVPFNFDVHAMIFSEDAPSLENAIHKAFENKKLNMVNQRREFFQVTLDEIKEVIRANYDKTADFIDVAEAEQYRISQKMRVAQ